MRPETTIVIAAYNEEERLPGSLEKIRAYLAAREAAAEVIVVDDGSSDKTADLVRNLARSMPQLRLISYPGNRGKGYALRKGVESSRGELVLLTDADLSTPIEELEKLKRHISRQSCQIAIGSRALPTSDIAKAQTAWRRGMGRFFNLMVRLLVIDGFNDTQCGFKLFSGDAARALFREACIDRFAYDVEILSLARDNGYRITEVPIRWENSPASKVNPVVDSLQMLGDLVRIRLASRPKQDKVLAPMEDLDL
ncbi:MAG TPA: glycosyl transferase [Geobacter sp.]|nr:glycosyl transferase [Geobacter sp.]